MARKIPAKRILEYRAMGLSRNLIARTKKVSRRSVSDVFNRAGDLDISYTDFETLSESDVYRRLLPERHQSEALYEVPEYAYIHKELKRVGVTLKLLWHEYTDKCQRKLVSVVFARNTFVYQIYLWKEMRQHSYQKDCLNC